MVYVLFLVLAAVLILLSIKLSDYVDLLDKTTKVSGAFIGGVLLAAVTSLPELFTSLSSVLLLKENSLVTGNILGSNLFNLTILGVAFAVAFRGFIHGKLGKSNLITLGAVIVIDGLIAVATFVRNTPQLGFVNIISPIILLLYITTLALTPKTEAPSEPFESPLTTKQIVVRFSIAAVLLIAASVAITYISNDIAEKLNLGKTFAGALLLGLTTSIPELVSTISLCRKRNFQAATGNILGSCVFNFVILVVADFCSFRKSNTNVFPFFRDGAVGMQSMLLLVLGGIAAIATLAMLLTKLYAQKYARLGYAVTIGSGVCVLTCYILFLVLSNVLA